MKAVFNNRDDKRKYLNSDLSEHIHYECGRSMTSIDVDIFQVKKSRNILRFIESKHCNEKMGYQQLDALKIIGDIARIVNNFQGLFKYKIEVYIVRGNKPYSDVIIHDLVLKRQYSISDGQKFNKWLELEYDLEKTDILTLKEKSFI